MPDHPGLTFVLASLTAARLTRRSRKSQVNGTMGVEKQAPRRVFEHSRGMADRHLWSVVDVSDATCSVPGCERTVEARGWCGAHYRRWIEHGEVFPERPLRERWHVTEIVGDKKRCSRCGEFKAFGEFAKRNRSPDGFHSRCKACQRAYWLANREERTAVHKKWLQANPERVVAQRVAYKERDRELREGRRPQIREQTNARNRALRDEALQVYGGACACCGESERAFLQIDHVNNDGAEHRREILRGKLERWLKRSGWPEGFQVLCCNCNFGRHINGGVCPHAETVGQLLGVA